MRNMVYSNTFRINRKSKCDEQIKNKRDKGYEMPYTFKAKMLAL